MRTTPLLVAAVLVLGACATDDGVIVTSRSAGDGASAAGSVPTGTDDVPTATDPAPGTDPELGTNPALTPGGDATDLLLTAADVPGFQHTGPMSFGAEPIIESPGCPALEAARAANAQPGTRTRGAANGVSFRHTVVEMPTEGAALEVMDAADRVWLECGQYPDAGAMKWTEPLEIPGGGWSAVGLAIGDDVGTYLMAFWQQGATVMVLEISGDEAWMHLVPLTDAVAGRIAGTPTPVPVPVSEPPLTTEPGRPIPTLPDPDPDPPVVVVPSVTLPPVTTAPEWLSHPLAERVPDAADIGPDWYRDEHVRIVEYEPGHPEDAMCGVMAPPQLDGLSVEYDGPGEIEIEIGRGSEADAQSWVDAVRGIADCQFPEDLGASELELVEHPGPAGADDSVFVRWTADLFQGSESFAVVGVARFGDSVVLLFWAALPDEDGFPAAPTVDRVVEVMELAAPR